MHAMKSLVCNIIWPLFLFESRLVSNCLGQQESRNESHANLTVKEGEVAGGILSVDATPTTRFTFAWCPPANFTMGSPASEADRDDDEDTAEVRLTAGFWMSQTEVTRKQWVDLMLSAPWGGYRVGIRKAWANAGMIENGVPKDENDKLPATLVSYADAMRFCHLLTNKAHESGKIPKEWVFTLPSEAQWEYACRADTRTAYYFGDLPEALYKYAWYEDNVNNEFNLYVPKPVGKLQPNAWGIYDMLGNVNEWCLDEWDPEYPGGEDPVVLGTEVRPGIVYVKRGGSFTDPPSELRCASRDAGTVQGCFETSGFRIVLKRR